jgi:hypothetical protein
VTAPGVFSVGAAGSVGTSSGTSFDVTSVSRTWAPGELLVVVFAADPGFGGTISLGESTGNFGPFGPPDFWDAQNGTGSAGVHTAAAWAACTTAFTGSTDVAASHPDAIARAEALLVVTGADGTTPMRGSATGLGAAGVSLDAGPVFDGLALLLTGWEDTGGQVMTPAISGGSGWTPVSPDLSAIVGTGFGAPTSNISVGWAAWTKNGADPAAEAASMSATTPDGARMAAVGLVFAGAAVPATTADAGSAAGAGGAPAPAIALGVLAAAGWPPAAGAAPQPAAEAAAGALPAAAAATGAAPQPRVLAAGGSAAPLLTGVTAGPPQSGWTAQPPHGRWSARPPAAR